MGRRFDRERLKQMGSEQELSDVEVFEDNIQYLRAMGTACREMIAKADYVVSNPDSEGFEPLAKEVRDGMETIGSIKKKSEESSGELFPSTELFEELELSPEEETIVNLLYSSRGVGIDPLEPSVKGEVLIALVNMIHGTPIEEGRKLLNESSRLLDKGIIINKDKRRYEKYLHPRSHRSRGSHYTEGMFFNIGERIVDMMLGEKFRDEEDDFKPPGSRHERPERSSKLVRKAETEFSLGDVVLKESLEDDIQGVMTQIREKEKLYQDWNLGKIAGIGKGINILFTGPSGTGKTLTAKVLGKELDMEVYIAEFNKLINCYYGETEKNVDSLFKILEEEETILLVDEADGILTRRTTAHGSVDSTENRIVNIFLQKMEEHSGVIILSSNLARGMDKALERRIALKVMFPKPDVDARKKIWDLHIPEETPIADDVSLEELAREYEFTGGQIKNAVLNAARKALTSGSEEIQMSHFIHACKNENKGAETMDYTLEDDKGKPKGYQ